MSLKDLLKECTEPEILLFKSVSKKVNILLKQRCQDDNLISKFNLLFSYQFQRCNLFFVVKNFILIKAIGYPNPEHLNMGMRDACFNGNITLVKELIERGADDLNGGLVNAFVRGYDEIVNLMLKLGADNNLIIKNIQK